MPDAGFTVPKKETYKLMHIELPIGQNLLIAHDVPEFMGRVNENLNRSRTSISAGTKEEADRLFNGLSAGGAVEVPISESPRDTYFGMFSDKYGIDDTDRKRESHPLNYYRQIIPSR